MQAFLRLTYLMGVIADQDDGKSGLYSLDARRRRAFYLSSHEGRYGLPSIIALILKPPK